MIQSGGIAITQIIIAADAPLLAERAANELRHYLAKALQDTLEISRGKEKSGCFYLSLLQNDWHDKRFDHSRTECHTGVIRLYGETPLCLQYAVYDFLQHYLNIHFFAPGKENECVPQREKLSLPEGENHDFASDFAIRDFVNRTNNPEVMSFAVKNRINSILGCGPWVNGSENCSQDNADLIHSFGLKVRGPGHCWKHFVPSEELYGEHPEYFSVVNGKRTVTGRTACFSNPEVRRLFRENLRQYLRQTPWWDIFAFWAEDVPDKNYCDCPECRRISASAWYLTLMNDAAKVVEEELPDALFEWIVYDSSETPPEITIPFYRNGSNMLCNICIGRFRDLFTPFAEQQNANNTVFARYAAWQKYLHDNNYCGKRMLMEYYNLCEYPNSGPCGRTFLWPLEVMQQDIQFYRQEGMAGLGAFTGLDRLCFPSPLRMWLWLQLWTDSNANIPKLKRDFYRAFYASKAEAAQQYMTLFERLMLALTDDRNIQMLEALRPAASLLTDAIVLHLEYAILVKRMYLAYLKKDVASYRKLEICYQSFQEANAPLLRNLVAPFPLLWFNHFTNNIGFLPDGTPKTLRPDLQSSLH